MTGEFQQTDLGSKSKMKAIPMKSKTASILRVAGLLVCVVSLNASAFITMDFVTVGNVGNSADSTTGYGAVNYGYFIGKYEVTLNQYTAFLNAVAGTDTYGLYNTSMATDQNSLGISRSGEPGSFIYSVIGSGNRPVTYVNWYDAARFANWMHNGQPSGIQSVFTTEEGAYSLNGFFSGTPSASFSRNVDAKYSIPSADEWYKAAYYQPTTQGGDSDSYWRYPTAHNVIPNSRNGSTSDPNSGNFFRNDLISNGFNGGYAVSQHFELVSVNYLTDVGAFTLADSYYGTFDQGGNVQEWTDQIAGSTGSNRILRGGSWIYAADALIASSYEVVAANRGADVVGFRLVMVPEPTTTAFFMLGFAALKWKRVRK